MPGPPGAPRPNRAGRSGAGAGAVIVGSVRTGGAVTLIDVAKAAGVSKTTASDALRGSGRVSESTRSHVVRTAQRLGYAPNPSARSLRGAGTGAVGLHVPDILARSEYYMSFLLGVVDEAAAVDHDVTLITARHLSPRGTLRRVDGVVLADPLSTDPVVAELMRADAPVVTCERFTGGTAPAGAVLGDHREALWRLLDRLRSAGARRPVLMAPNAATDWGATLQRAFRDHCRETGTGGVLHELPFGVPPAEVRARVKELLAADPAVDALLCGPDGSAQAALPAVYEAGRTPGADLLLAACVDAAGLAQSAPPVTAVDLHPREAGAACARLLFDLLSGTAPPGTVRRMECTLVERASTRELRRPA